MPKIVAIDDSLTNLMEPLKSNGYNITSIGDEQTDVIVLNGIDNNFLGMEDIIYDVPVINAEGKTPDEILEELKSL